MFKQKDLITLAIVVLSAAILSIIISSLVFGGKSSDIQIENVPLISSNFPKSQDLIFQNLNIDPTVLIHINNNNNGSPFTSGH
jgi:hypothetical protein